VSARPAALDVWLYDTLTAHLEAHGDRVRLTWSDAASQTFGLGSRVLSQLLPTQTSSDRPHDLAVTVFLAGLLAEGHLREHLAVEAGVTSDDIFGLVGAYGRDTAGALIFVPAGEPPSAGRWDKVGDGEIATLLRAAGRFAPGGIDSISLTGLQPKIALRRHDQTWFRCRAGAASTHILKLGAAAGEPLEDLIHTEAACLDLACRIGLTTVGAQVEMFDGTPALVVSRYDRVSQPDGSVVRVHQEDSAQALGIDTSDLNRKFQRGKVLPSLRSIAKVLRDGGSEPDQLAALTTFNLAVGNSDAHAKNISVLRHRDGFAELAPAYDISAHAHYPTFNGLFAMDVNGKTLMPDMTGSDLIAEAQGWPLSVRRARRAVETTLVRLDEALRVIDRDDHGGVTAQAWAHIEDRTRQLLETL
jgi:serine/threonine-protein kinase HipA